MLLHVYLYIYTDIFTHRCWPAMFIVSPFAGYVRLPKGIELISCNMCNSILVGLAPCWWNIMRYPLDPKMVLEPHSRNPSALGDELQKSKIVTHHFVIKHGSGKSMNRWYVSLFTPFPDDVSINNAIYIFCLAIFLQDFPHGNSPWLFHRMSEVHEWDEVGLTEMFRREPWEWNIGIWKYNELFMEYSQ